MKRRIREVVGFDIVYVCPNSGEAITCSTPHAHTANGGTIVEFSIYDCPCGVPEHTIHVCDIVDFYG